MSKPFLSPERRQALVWSWRECFAADGCRLVLVARKGMCSRRWRLTAQGPQDPGAGDHRRPRPAGSPDRLLAHLHSAGLKVDVLVNNAAFGAQGKFAGLPLGRQLEMLQVNMTSLTHLTGLLLPGMIERRRGGILNVASTAAFQPGPGMAVYYATKAYVLSFSEALAEELAGTGVTVTAVCPGPTATNFGTAANMRTLGMVKKVSMSAETVALLGHRAYRQREGGCHHRFAQPNPGVPHPPLSPCRRPQDRQAPQQRKIRLTSLCNASSPPAQRMSR